MHLGNYGAEHPEITATFGWFGATIRVHPDLSDLAFLDLIPTMEMGGADMTTDFALVAGLVDAVKAMATALVHPEDFDEFWGLAKKNRQTMEDIADLGAQLIEATTDRPTGLPSDSSDGQQATGTSSTGDSSSRALRLLEDRGRPDLAVAVLRAQEAG